MSGGGGGKPSDHSLTSSVGAGQWAPKPKRAPARVLLGDNRVHGLQRDSAWLLTGEPFSNELFLLYGGGCTRANQMYLRSRGDQRDMEGRRNTQ